MATGNTLMMKLEYGEPGGDRPSARMIAKWDRRRQARLQDCFDCAKYQGSNLEGDRLFRGTDGYRSKRTSIMEFQTPNKSL